MNLIPSRFDTFRDKQKKIIEAASKERKLKEVERLKQQERDYWNDINWQIDVAYDGSDSQPYEPGET